jgi:methylmalonyl-CoA mutase
MPASTDKLFADFPPVSTADWAATVAKDLKGKDPSTLDWKTEDGFTVKPYYRAEDVKSPLPVPTKAGPGWAVRYEVAVADASDANAIAKRAVVKGAQQIIFTGLTPADREIAAAGLEVPVRFSFDAAVRSDLWHNAGATAVEELAFALAAGVEHLNSSGADAANDLEFEFAIGPNYFFEIAKLRAARLLWAQILDACGVRVKMNIAARTSTWNQTVYDPHNNLLRGTTEAMSAALGGADAITVVPFDAPYREPDDFSRHLALNTQLVLRDEAYFDKVNDAAAGSYYLETLTENIAREAWKLFQQVEAMGGLTAAIQAGFVDQTIAKSRAACQKLINQRRRVFVGVNQYPNLRETALQQIEKEPPAYRATVDFEALRLATEKHAKRTGKNPVVLLVTLGDRKMRRARADYVTSFFGIAGFTISEPPAFPSAEAAADHAKDAKADIAVLCSSDPEYSSTAGPLISRLRAGGVKTPVLVAGYPTESIEPLRAAGVADFIHVKSDPIATLKGWQQKLGVSE